MRPSKFQQSVPLITEIITKLLLLGLLIVFMWGCYNFTKRLSYKIFYEDMVKQTIQQTVKTDSLIKQ